MSTDSEVTKLLKAILAVNVQMLSELKHLRHMAGQQGMKSLGTDPKQQTLDNLDQSVKEVHQALNKMRWF